MNVQNVDPDSDHGLLEMPDGTLCTVRETHNGTPIYEAPAPWRGVWFVVPRDKRPDIVWIDVGGAQ